MSLSRKNTDEFRAVLILQALGFPKEHLVGTLNDLAQKISSEEGVYLVEKKINEPKELEEKKGYFLSYAEIEITFKEPNQLIILMFKYMPAHVELISPENLVLSNNNFSSMLNELTRRLHGYEELARIFQVQKGMFEKKIKELSDKKENPLNKDSDKKTEKASKKKDKE